MFVKFISRLITMTQTTCLQIDDTSNYSRDVCGFSFVSRVLNHSKFNMKECEEIALIDGGSAQC